MIARLKDTGEEYMLRLTTESSASSYGRAVAVVTAGPDATLLLDLTAWWEVIECAEAEAEQWREAGYSV